MLNVEDMDFFLDFFFLACPTACIAGRLGPETPGVATPHSGVTGVLAEGGVWASGRLAGGLPTS